MTTVTIDEPSHLRRWTIGDSYSDTGLLGGGLFLAGIGVSRDYGLDPGLVALSHPGPLGRHHQPVDGGGVCGNHRLVRREQVAAGQFSCSMCPFPMAGRMRGS